MTLAAGAYPAFVLSRVRPVSAIATGQARLGSSLFSTLLVGTQFGVASFLLIAVTVISMQNAEMRRTALSAIEDPLVIIENPAKQTRSPRPRCASGSASCRKFAASLSQGHAMGVAVDDERQRALPIPRAPQRTAVTRQIGFDFFDVFDVPLVAGRVFDRAHAEDVPRPLPRTAGRDPGRLGLRALEGRRRADLPRRPAGRVPGRRLRSPTVRPATARGHRRQPPAEPLPPTNIVVDRDVRRGARARHPEEAIDQLVYRPAPCSGRRLPLQSPPPLRIIGVVEDRSFSFFKTPNNVTARCHLSHAVRPRLTVARVAAADVDGALERIDAAWQELAPGVAISRRFLDEIFERAYAQYVRINQLFGTLAVMAFAICVAGLFGMAIFVAGRRRHEIGVRKTLGGSTAQMIRLLLVGFSRPVLVANLIAWPAGYFAARAYLNQFSESIDLTPWPFVLSVLITLAIAWLAVVGQTLRAARTTPAEVLRHE